MAGSSNDRATELIEGEAEEHATAGGRAAATQRREARRSVKLCQLCLDKARAVDYKDVTLLKLCISERGRILPRRRTGLCAKHQRMIARAIKRARHIALLPYTAAHVREQAS